MQSRTGDRPVIAGVTEREHAAVRGHQPVTGSVGSRTDADDGPLQDQAAGRPVELRRAEGEDAAVGADEPIAVGTGGRRRRGWRRGRRTAGDREVTRTAGVGREVVRRGRSGQLAPEHEPATNV